MTSFKDEIVNCTCYSARMARKLAIELRDIIGVSINTKDAAWEIYKESQTIIEKCPVHGKRKGDENERW